MRIGRTLTKAFDVETRQHDLLGMDLGEGPRRSHLRIALVVGALWILLCIPFVGVPNPYTLSLYILPPGILIAFGVQESPKQPRRVRMTDWLLAARYTFSSHKPIIWLGARTADRRECVPLPVRLHWGRLKEMPGFSGLVGAFAPAAALTANDSDHSHKGPVGKPIIIEQRTRMIGTDYLHALAAKQQAKAAKARKK